MADLKELIKKLKEDTDFAQDLRNANSKEVLIEKLKTAGFELSNDDLEDVLKMLDAGQLSDKELEGASGGMRQQLETMV